MVPKKNKSRGFMNQKVGRNDPCPCGSGKKYKQCCIKLATQKKKIKAVLIKGGPKPGEAMPDLVERTFGEAINQLKEKPVDTSQTHLPQEEKESL